MNPDNKEPRLKIVNSQVVLTPSDSVSPPKIVPSRGITVYVNGQEIKEPTVITETDKIIIEGTTKTIEKGALDVQVSHDRLSCRLFLKKALKIRYNVEDAPDTSLLEPCVREEEYEEDMADLEQIKNFLLERNITYGLDEKVLAEIVLHQEAAWLEIAKGFPPTPGTDAKLDVLFSENSSFTYDDEHIENVDYRDKGHILSIDEGTLLAEKTPLIPGISGKSVTGKELAPPPIQDIILKAGKNTYLSEDKLKVYASISGRPVKETKKNQCTLSVQPIYVLEGDVDLDSGNVHFQGDVEIRGKVMEKMEVSSGGTIKIFGSVHSALIKAEGSITITNNVINSRILAGTRQSFALQVYAPLRDFESSLVSILKAYQQLKEKPEFSKTRYGYLLDLLVEKKYPHLKKQLDTLYKALEVQFTEDFPEDFMSTVTSVRDGLKNFYPLPYQDIQDTVNLLKQLTELKAFFTDEPSEASTVNLMYCLNSYLECSGSVTIMGQGSFRTDIKCHDTIDIKGVLRGGTISAKKDIIVNKVGSEAAIVTNIFVPTGQAVYINEAFENTRIHIGSHMYRFTNPLKRVKAFKNKGHDKIQITSF